MLPYDSFETKRASAALWPRSLLPARLLRSWKSVRCMAGGAALGRKSSESCSPVCCWCRNQEILPAPHRNSRDFFFLWSYPLLLPACRSVSVGLCFGSFFAKTSRSVFPWLENGTWPLWWIFLHFASYFASRFGCQSFLRARTEQTGHNISVLRWIDIEANFQGRQKFRKFKKEFFLLQSPDCSWRHQLGRQWARNGLTLDFTHRNLYPEHCESAARVSDLFSELHSGFNRCMICVDCAVSPPPPPHPPKKICRKTRDSHIIMRRVLEKMCCTIEPSREAAWLALWISLNLHSILR